MSYYNIFQVNVWVLKNIADVVAAKAASGIAMISGVLDGEGNISEERTRVLVEAFDGVEF